MMQVLTQIFQKKPIKNLDTKHKKVISKWKEAITTILGEDLVNAHLKNKLIK